MDDVERGAGEWEADYRRMLDERDAVASDLRRTQAKLDEALAALEDARARAVQDYVREGAGSDAWMTVGQIRQALEQVDADHAAELEAALADVERLERENGLLARVTDNGRGVPTYYLWEPNGTRVELVRLARSLAQYEELASAHRALRAALTPVVVPDDPAARAALVESLLDEGQVLYAGALDLLSTDVRTAFDVDAALAIVKTTLFDIDAEPANGTVVVDSAHIAWQRRDADALEAPADHWFQVGQEDGDPWTTVTAPGPVTVVWTPTVGEPRQR